MSKKVKKLIADSLIFLVSISFAILLLQSGTLDSFIEKVSPVKFLAEFIAGLFFTSFLTIPFSLTLLYGLAGSADPLQIALVAGLGASIADMLIIRVFRNSFFNDFETLERILKLKRVFHFFHHSHFNHLAPFLGILIIPSPFPDEVGLMMLGASKLKTLQLFLLTFIINTIGIYLISIGTVLI